MKNFCFDVGTIFCVTLCLQNIALEYSGVSRGGAGAPHELLKKFVENLFLQHLLTKISQLQHKSYVTT